jgi:hypothetical protein
MRTLAARLVRLGIRMGWRRGIVDGNRTWVVIGGVALVGHLAGRAIGRKEETVFKEALRPGESVRITHLPKP